MLAARRQADQRVRQPELRRARPPGSRRASSAPGGRPATSRRRGSRRARRTAATRRTTTTSSTVPSSSNDTMPPKPVIWRRAISWPGMVRQAGEVDASNERMSGERIGDRRGVLGVTLDPELERLQSAQRQPAVERRRHRAGRVLEELDRLEDRGVPRQHRALDQVRVAGEVLRHAVNDDVGAELERLLEHRRRERVVDDDERAARRARRRRCAAMS